jgi:hypothetical protein
VEGVGSTCGTMLLFGNNPRAASAGAAAEEEEEEGGAVFELPSRRTDGLVLVRGASSVAGVCFFLGPDCRLLDAPDVIKQTCSGFGVWGLGFGVEGLEVLGSCLRVRVM